MSKEFKIEVHKRNLSEKKSVLKTLRNDGKVPGIYYSFDSSDSVPLFIDKKTLKEASKSGAKIFNIAVGSDNKNVIFKSIQYHPVTDEILHIDLYGVDMNRAVVVKVPIILDGTAIGVSSEGGVLVQSLNEFDIECLPADIPDSITVDVSELSIGDSIKAADVEIDDKFNLKSLAEQTIASVTHAMKEEELVPSTEEDEEFMEEGEDAAESTEESPGDSSSKEDDSDGNKESTEG